MPSRIGVQQAPNISKITLNQDVDPVRNAMKQDDLNRASPAEKELITKFYKEADFLLKMITKKQPYKAILRTFIHSQLDNFDRIPVIVRSNAEQEMAKYDEE